MQQNYTQFKIIRKTGHLILFPKIHFYDFLGNKKLLGANKKIRKHYVYAKHHVMSLVTPQIKRVHALHIISPQQSLPQLIMRLYTRHKPNALG